MTVPVNETETRPGVSAAAFEGQCRRCPETVSGDTAAEATEAAMGHAGDAHGDSHLGFRWNGPA